MYGSRLPCRIRTHAGPLPRVNGAQAGGVAKNTRTYHRRAWSLMGRSALHVVMTGARRAGGAPDAGRRLAHSVLGRLAIYTAQKRATMMDCDAAATPMVSWRPTARRWGTVQITEALCVQRLQKARKDAVAERTALEARADNLDAALDAAKMPRQRIENAAPRSAPRKSAAPSPLPRPPRSNARSRCSTRELMRRTSRLPGKNHDHHRRRRRSRRRRQDTEDYRACLARALANATDANETVTLARVYARTVTTCVVRSPRPPRRARRPAVVTSPPSAGGRRRTGPRSSPGLPVKPAPVLTDARPRSWRQRRAPSAEIRRCSPPRPTQSSRPPDRSRRRKSRGARPFPNSFGSDCRLRCCCCIGRRRRRWTRAGPPPRKFTAKRRSCTRLGAAPAGHQSGCLSGDTTGGGGGVISGFNAQHQSHRASVASQKSSWLSNLSTPPAQPRIFVFAAEARDAGPQ